jgi:alpha-tubulin suppressor-like RCC1 family protein
VVKPRLEKSNELKRQAIESYPEVQKQSSNVHSETTCVLVYSKKSSVNGDPKFKATFENGVPMFSKPNFYIFDSGIKMVAAGIDFCLALNNSGNVLSWGANCSALGYPFWLIKNRPNR